MVLSKAAVPDRLRDALRAIVPRSARNWFRSPAKSAAWVWDSVCFISGKSITLEISPNFSLECHPRVSRIFRRDRMEDPEQTAEFRAFISSCSKTMALYDIGAHFGIFSLAAAHFGGKAVAVDASPVAVRMIEIEAELNQCGDKIEIICAAVSDRNGEVDMMSSGVFSDGYFKTTKRMGRDITKVPATTIDQMVPQFGPPTHIKIDVEGHERSVLRGATETLHRFSPVLFLELHNQMILTDGDDPREVLDDLAGFQYETFASSGRAINAHEILAKPIVRIIASRGNRRGCAWEASLGEQRIKGQVFDRTTARG
jgi:FkbM family methyltransferase